MAVVSLVAAAVVAAGASAAWVQPRMMVSIWYDPVVQSSDFYNHYRSAAAR